MQKVKPIVRINMAMTLDGHVAHPTQSWNFGSAEDRRRMDRLRSWADCLIVSRKTLEHDDMDLRVRTRPQGKHPHPVILTHSSKPLRNNLHILKHSQTVGEIWVSHENAALTLSKIWPEQNKPWSVFSYAAIDEIVESLRMRGFTKILLEGGPTLNGLFFEKNLVDELNLTLLPILWGGTTHDRTVVTHAPLPLTRFVLRRAEKRHNEMFFRYVRK